MSYKEDILILRENGLSFSEIKEKLGCSKATISYHCKKWGLSDIGLGQIKIKIKKEKINEYYKTHTKKETAYYFNISETSVYNNVEKKRIVLSDDEKRVRNYNHVKTRRQKLKELSIEYKGGKCIKCGYKKSKWSLQFHHKNPIEKEFNISEYLVLSWSKIKKELDKCILICSNCHFELHEKEFIENEIKKTKLKIV